LLSQSEYFGLLAGLFQFIAYGVYIRFFLKDSIRPNPLSWVMFAYGTALMLFLEWKGGAGWSLLALPAVCAIMSVFVAIMSLRQPVREPVGTWEKGAFVADIGLTMAYLLASMSALIGPLFAATFIAAGNLTTLTAFFPIMISTWRSPHNERIEPWLLWTSAYGLLIVSTLMSVGMTMPALLIYPILCTALHGSLALMILRTQKSDSDLEPNEPTVYISNSEIAGSGIFAIGPFEAGAWICLLRGPKIKGPVPMEHGPNWVGIGQDVWIDPEFPIGHINHSCEPNAAFTDGLILRALRPIRQDEEVTMDYSTTEADPSWQMSCACGTPTCRKTLTSIQTAFAGAPQPPPALPAMQEIWRQSQVTKQSGTNRQSGHSGHSLGNRTTPEPA
jgi:SET domain